MILRQLIEEEAQDAGVAVIADPQAVAQAAAAGVGNRVTLDLGGKTDDRHGAPPSQRIRSASNSAFCQARGVLPLDILKAALRQTARHIQAIRSRRRTRLGVSTMCCRVATSMSSARASGTRRTAIRSVCL